MIVAAVTETWDQEWWIAVHTTDNPSKGEQDPILDYLELAYIKVLWCKLEILGIVTMYSIYCILLSSSHWQAFWLWCSILINKLCVVHLCLIGSCHILSPIIDSEKTHLIIVLILLVPEGDACCGSSSSCQQENHPRNEEMSVMSHKEKAK